MKILAIGPRAGEGLDRWVAILHFERDGVPEVTMLQSVSSYAEAVERQRSNGCDRMWIPSEVIVEMVAAGVGPQVG